jgi:hypothetical protein
MTDALIEAVSADVHAAWIETKLAQGVTSRPSSDGVEQMVPYDELPDHIKELDRSTVRAVFASPALQEALGDFEYAAQVRDGQNGAWVCDPYNYPFGDIDYATNQMNQWKRTMEKINGSVDDNNYRIVKRRKPGQMEPV